MKHRLLILPSIATLLALAPIQAHGQAGVKAQAGVGVFERGKVRPYRQSTVKSSGKHFKATSTYPQFTASTPLARFVNTKLRTEAQKNMAAFAKEAQSGENGDLSSESNWEYSDQTKVYSVFPSRLISLGTTNYSYTGGVHGNYGTSGRNFAISPGTSQPRELKLADFFRAGSPYRTRIANLLMAKLRATQGKEQEASFVIDGSVKNVSDFLDNFVVERGGLRWFFSPYSVGPYAAGEIEVKLPIAELGPDFKRTML